MRRSNTIAGFKNLNQAQLLTDVLYYASNNDSQQWLIYYISRPLLGNYESVNMLPATLLGSPTPNTDQNPGPSNESGSLPKKEVKTFNELLNQFPMIARQMQPGLDRLFKEFGKELGKPLPPPPSQSSSLSSTEVESEVLRSDASTSSKSPNGQAKLPFNSASYFEDDEDLMRRALETAVTAAIDLFQLVDKQQLSYLGATTDLTGPLVERLIERYVSEQVHHSLLFPRLCDYRKSDDLELDSRIRQMENIDVSQVGIVIEGGRKGKEGLILRLKRGVEEFRKMGVAGSPQEMLEILLSTEKVVTLAAESPEDSPELSEKKASVLTINADILVSLLLIVVIRSQVRHLQARLCYMQHFIYIDDVESGEMGYALSTFEAVLSYLMRDSGGLRKASSRNKRLWQATKTGKISDMKAILEPDEDSSVFDEAIVDEPEEKIMNRHRRSSSITMNGSVPEQAFTIPESSFISTSETSTLAHVFPFRTRSNSSSSAVNSKKVVKRVSMDIKSLSGSSVLSFLSRTTTIGSTTSAIEGDTSIESLTKTQDPTGDSVPMMAVEAGQGDALRYLLSLDEYYTVESILEDCNSQGTTLLSAAVQLAHTEVIDIILDFIFKSADKDEVSAYIAKGDTMRRTVGHYLFNAPHLVQKLGFLIPWEQKDKNGQTPLFALCRSYDHPNYALMVDNALSVAHTAQGDGLPLRLDAHVDNKGNTLLHIVSDAEIALRILHHCDVDPNATNDKRFTPLMVASKYGRIDMVRALFGDPRVDLYLRELRGFTAIELAKDDDVRNRIDDLILFSNPASADGRITTVVRSFFVEDATVRFILKSGAPNPSKASTYTITTCRRSLTDFENLAKWLAVEHPASYLPGIFNFRHPFQIHSKPSRAVLHDMQIRLDRFLKVMLAHPTFGTHELLWEFFLVPELQPEMMASRSKMKAQVRAEMIEDEYDPITDATDVEQFISHARGMVRNVNNANRLVLRRLHGLQQSTSDFADSLGLCATAVTNLARASVLPTSHTDAFTRYAWLHATSSDSSPLSSFLTTTQSLQMTTLALLSALTRPDMQIAALRFAQNTLNRNLQSSYKFHPKRPMPIISLPGMEESRARSHAELLKKIEKGETVIERLGKELWYTLQVVAGELAGWQAWKVEVGRTAVRSFVKEMVVRERERGKGLERCLRRLREMK
jgi:ankyrin repeat protein